MGQVVYYKVGKPLLQSEVGINRGGTLSQSGATVTEKASTSSRHLDKWKLMFTDRVDVVREWNFEDFELLTFGRLSTKQFPLMFLFRRLKFIIYNKV